MRTIRWVLTLMGLLLPMLAAVTMGTAVTAAGSPTAGAADIPTLTLKQGPRRDGDREVSLGVQFHGTWGSYSDAQREEVLRKLADMGATWVRIDIGWTNLQEERGPIDTSSWGYKNINKVITMAHDHGLNVLGTLWLTPRWAQPSGGDERSAPDNLQQYADALTWAAAHWKGMVQAWEVWNEPNSEDFLRGANPVQYTRLLCTAYRTVKADQQAKDVPILFGGTMHNDTAWIERTYEAGVKGCYDIMAVHPYQVPSGTSPREGDGADAWEFEHLRAVRKLMKANGDTSPVWVTEVGWSSHANNGNEPAWAVGVTEAQQARYSVMAMNMIQKRYRFVKKVFFYNERAVQGSGVHMAGYGIMTNDLRTKPVYNALSRWARR